MLINAIAKQRCHYADIVSPDVIPELQFFTRRAPENAIEAQKLQNCLVFVCRLLANDPKCASSISCFHDIRQWCIEKFDLLSPRNGLMLMVSTVAWCLGKLGAWSEQLQGHKKKSIDKLRLLCQIMGDRRLYETMLPSFGMLPAELRRVVRAGFDTGFTFGQLLQLECIELSLANLHKLAAVKIVTKILPGQSLHMSRQSNRSQSPSLEDDGWIEGRGSNHRSDNDAAAAVVSGSQCMHLFLFCQVVYMAAGKSGRIPEWQWKLVKSKLVVLDTLAESGVSPHSVYSSFLQPFVEVQSRFPNQSKPSDGDSLKYQRCVARLLSMLRYDFKDRFLIDAVRSLSCLFFLFLLFFN